MKKTPLLTLFALFVFALNGLAQMRPPALVAKVKDKHLPMVLQKLETEVKILGFIAETQMTMTFHNPRNQVLSGTLYFPLPEGSTVSCYGLDIQGKMIEGVVVEKQKARVVFEKIVRQGIDPGLVEWTKGNNFKTRVFPIPAKGTRTIMVRYVSEIHGNKYQLPLQYKEKLASFSMKVKVLQGRAKPKAVGGALAKVEFVKWEQGFTAETNLKDVQLSQPIVIDLPTQEGPDVIVERASDGNCYFAVTDRPAIPERKQAVSKPSRIAIVWDASGSRAGNGREKELAFLEALMGPDGRQWAKATLDLIVVRNRAERTITFKAGTDRKGILDKVRSLHYDGGTQLGALQPDPKAEAPDFYLVFSDGLSTFGSDLARGFKAPVYTISADVSKNAYYLKELALRTGGKYLNLQRQKPEAAAAQVGRSTFGFQNTNTTSKEVETYPAMPTPIVGGRFILAGKLSGKEATVTLNYGYPSQVTSTRKVTVRRSDAVDSDLLRRYWAQKKLNTLLIDQKEHEKKIVALGKEYGLVTPYTSLIVLDNVRQYIEHEIRPPASLPQMRKQYDVAMANRAQQRERIAKKNMARVLAMWQQRMAWYDRAFKYPKGFKYTGGNKGKARDGRQAGDAAELEARNGPPPPPRPDAGAPEDDDDDDGDAVAGGEGPESKEEADKLKDAESETVDAFRITRGLPVNKPKPNENGKDSGAAAISLKKWDPKTPYIAALKKAKHNERFAVYMTQKKDYGSSPAFYLDCANYFESQNASGTALQVLSNIAELELENAALLRVLAHRLVQTGQVDLGILVFEEVLRMRPEEPQSYRDLALTYIRRAKTTKAMMAKMAMTLKVAQRLNAGIRRDRQRACELLAKVVSQRWDRFDQIELIALTELNAMFGNDLKWPLDPKLQKVIPHDVRIIMTWDADSTDMDLWVTEPSGEKVDYSHNRSTIGGRMSRDFTNGYGPEEYTVRKAMNGTYKIQANFYGSRSVDLAGAVTIQIDIYTNYGTPKEQHKSITRRLTTQKDVIDLGVIEF